MQSFFLELHEVDRDLCHIHAVGTQSFSDVEHLLRARLVVAAIGIYVDNLSIAAGSDAVV